MKKSHIIVAILIVIAALAFGVLYTYESKKKIVVSEQLGETNSSRTAPASEPDYLSPMEAMYASMTGDDFDKAYISDMLAHHQGGLDMASYAANQASKPEIKTLSANIMTTQSAEVNTMFNWQQEWGYAGTDSNDPHASHAAMEAGGSMTDNMAEMTAKLTSLRGEDFDREFLTQMIEHHQQAVDMSKFADQNAKHQELKDFAKEVIRVQEKEIADMKRWQKLWGY